MNEATVTLLDLENVARIWPQVAPLIEKSITMSGTHTLDDVLQFILQQKAQLWVQWNGGVQAAVVTEMVDFPRARLMRIWLAGAKEGREAKWEEFSNMTKAFALANKCSIREVIGREGWKKFAKNPTKIVVLREDLGGG